MRLRVLLVEGDADHAALLQRALTAADFRVDLAAGMETARARARQSVPDVLVSCERLPDGTAAALMRLLHSDGVRVPVVVMTARGESGLVDALQAGASDVAEKVVGLEHILPILVRQCAARTSARMHVHAGQLEEDARVAFLEAQFRRQETALRVREGQLQEANRRAAEATLQRSQLLANVSHELRTPLTTIVGFTGVLLDCASGPLTPEQAKQLELIQRAANQLLALINDLLDITRLEAGLTEVVVLPVEVRALCLDLRNVTLQLVENRAVEVIVEGGPALIESDPAKVRQILWNVCVNAARATQKGRITMKIEPFDEGVAIRVEDTSNGIPPDELERVFEKFAPLGGGKKRPRTQSSGGTSLGLALASDLAVALGGELTVASTLGQGTVFTLRLPRKPTPRATP